MIVSMSRYLFREQSEIAVSVDLRQDSGEPGSMIPEMAHKWGPGPL